MFVQRGADQVPGLAGDGLATRSRTRAYRIRERSSASATRVLEFVSRSGRIATDQKAVRTRGPGRVVLGSKPQLATTEKFVSWAEVRDCQELLPKSINCYD